MWSLVAFIGLAIFLVGAVSIAKPLRALKVSSRGRGALVALLGLIVLGIGASNDPETKARIEAEKTVAATDTPTATGAVTRTPEPEQSCKVEVNDEAMRPHAAKWCEGGIFSVVNARMDARNFVVVLQFTERGIAAWKRDHLPTLNRFRVITNEMATAGDMNVAFSIHDPTGQMVGACARKRSESEPICNGS